MLASGPIGLTVLCLFQAGVQIEAGARVEAGAGTLPTGTSVMLAAIPSLKLDWLAGSDVLKADLSTRILWRPVSHPHNRPLFLQTLGMVYDARPSPQSQWHVELRASYGEQDYTSLSRQFATQPSLPMATTMFMIDGWADALWLHLRQTNLAFRMGASHRRSLHEQGSETGGFSPLPTQTMVTADPQLRLVLSRRLTAEISIPVSVYDLEQTDAAFGQDRDVSMNLFSLQPQLHVSGMLTQRERLRFLAGVTYADTIRGPTEGSRHQFTPLALVGFDSDLSLSRSALLRSSANVQSAWILDPVVGRGVWRAIASVGCDAQFGLRWGTGLHFSAAANISKPPTGSNASGMEQDTSVVSADTFVRYQWTRVLVAELGGRYSERGQRRASSGVATGGREVWGFLTLYTGSRMTLNSNPRFRSMTGSGI